MIMPPKPSSSWVYWAEHLLEMTDISYEDIQQIQEWETRGLVFASHSRWHFGFKKIAKEIDIEDEEYIKVPTRWFAHDPIPFILDETWNVITPTNVKFDGCQIIISLPNKITGTLYLR